MNDEQFYQVEDKYGQSIGEPKATLSEAMALANSGYKPYDERYRTGVHFPLHIMLVTIKCVETVLFQ